MNKDAGRVSAIAGDYKEEQSARDMLIEYAALLQLHPDTGVVATVCDGDDTYTGWIKWQGDQALPIGTQLTVLSTTSGVVKILEKVREEIIATIKLHAVKHNGDFATGSCCHEVREIIDRAIGETK